MMNSGFVRWLLRLPIFYKILIANSAIVGLGAVAGTMITVWHVRRYPNSVHYELIAFFAGAAILISFFVNRQVLGLALSPLHRLQAGVDQVRQGDLGIRVEPGRVSDEQFDRLADTFNAMLAGQSDHARQMQQLSHQILYAQETERQRLARELHDEAAQALTSLLVHLRLLERAHDPEKARQQVQALRELTGQALEEVRRVALDLRPTILDDLGLATALEWRVDEFNRAEEVQATVQIKGLDRRLSREVELVFYRVGQEALSNVARHAQAQHVEVSLCREDGQLRLKVVDDGVGFDPAGVPTGAANHRVGLLGMRERLAMIGGALRVEAAPGGGTRLLAQAPLDHDGAQEGSDD